MKMMSHRLLSLLTILLFGCSSTTPAGKSISAASGKWMSTSERQLIPTEASALNVVKQHEEAIMRREARDYFYTVLRYPQEIHVRIVYGFGYHGTQPIFVPNAQSTYVVNADFKIIDTTP